MSDHSSGFVQSLDWKLLETNHGIEAALVPENDMYYIRVPSRSPNTLFAASTTVVDEIRKDNLEALRIIYRMLGIEDGPSFS